MKQNFYNNQGPWQDNQMSDQNNFYPSWQGYGEGYDNYNNYSGGYSSSNNSPYSYPPEQNPLISSFRKGGKVTAPQKFGKGGFFRKPFKATAASVGSFGGAILGNMIAPGFGGVVGGAIGQGLQHKLRGKRFREGAVKGAAIGAALPSAASLAGSGLNSMGYTGAGGYLSDYGAANALLPSLGIGAVASGPASSVAGGSSLAGGAAAPSIASAAPLAGAAAAPAVPAASSAAPVAEKSFLGSLAANSKSFFSQPMNLLSLGVLGSMMLDRQKKQPSPREKTPEERANEEKRYALASMMNAEELQAWENAQTGKEQAKRRVERNKFLPEERLGDIEPIYRKTNSPEEYRKTGRWFSYYDNPEYNGRERAFKSGGGVFSEEDYVETPRGLSFFMEGKSGGQDDDRRMDLRDGSYIIDASTTANLGDGNSRAGAEKINALVSDGETYIAPEGVAKIGQGDIKKGVSLLDRLVKNVRKHKSGSTKLPPKAMSVASYMKGKKR